MSHSHWPFVENSKSQHGRNIWSQCIVESLTRGETEDVEYSTYNFGVLYHIPLSLLYTLLPSTTYGLLFYILCMGKQIMSGLQTTFDSFSNWSNFNFFHLTKTAGSGSTLFSR